MKSISHFFFLFLLLSCNPSSTDSTADSENGDELNSPPPTQVTNPIDPIDPIERDEMTDDFLSLVNNHRKKKGLRELRLDTSMNEIALKHSQDMASAKVRFGHDGFSTRCSLAREALGGGNLCLENVAWGQKNSEEVFNAWINSSGHRKNIEHNRATHMGLGYAKNSKGVYYWTQLFLER